MDYHFIIPKKKKKRFTIDAYIPLNIKNWYRNWIYTKLKGTKPSASTRCRNEEEKLPEASITHRKRGNYVSEINREPVNEYSRTIRHAKHTHTRVHSGIRESLREVAIMRNTEHRERKGRAWTFYRRNVPARPPTIDEQRGERKKKKESAEEDGAQRGVWVEGLKESSHVSASRRWNGNECSSR